MDTNETHKSHNNADRPYGTEQRQQSPCKNRKERSSFKERDSDAESHEAELPVLGEEKFDFFQWVHQKKL